MGTYVLYNTPILSFPRLPSDEKGELPSPPLIRKQFPFLKKYMQIDCAKW